MWTNRRYGAYKFISSNSKNVLQNSFGIPQTETIWYERRYDKILIKKLCFLKLSFIKGGARGLRN